MKSGHKKVVGDLTILDGDQVEKVTPRGMRLNNPGNIRHGDKWEGMAKEQKDKSFINFSEPKYGIRAMARIIGDSYKKKGIERIEDIISRWAPEEDNNDVESYIKSVLQFTGLGDRKKKIKSDSQLALLIAGIINHENGKMPYSMEDIKSGIKLAKRKE